MMMCVNCCTVWYIFGVLIKVVGYSIFFGDDRRVLFEDINAGLDFKSPFL